MVVTMTPPLPTTAPSNVDLDLPELLVIDDDPTTRQLMSRIFGSEYKVSTAANGPAALELLRNAPIDVVLLDIMMPGMNGFAVLEAIRSNPDTADLPVVMASALNDTENIVKGLQLGANDYVTKPLNIHVARARLRTQARLKRLLDEQKQSAAQMAQLNHLRERFFRIASHDPKNPLANLRLAQHELNHFIPQTPDTEFIQSAINMTLDEMQALIEDFLDMAALQNTELNLTLDYVNLGDCVYQVVRQFGRSADRKDIRLCVGDVGDVVIADRQRLCQVIGNLVSNAIKFSSADSAINLWSERVGDCTRLYVEDQGPGISEEDQKRLFREFTRASTRPTAGELSTGLGLWIVKHLTHLLGGTVGLDSVPGEGSTFWIELPAYVPEAAD